jgi:hypothetical protein
MKTLEEMNEINAAIAREIFFMNVVSEKWPCVGDAESPFLIPDPTGAIDKNSIPWPVFAVQENYKVETELPDVYYYLVQPVPDYAGDIKAAWIILEKFRRGWNNHAAACIEMTVFDSGGPMEVDSMCRIYSPDLLAGKAITEDMALSICLAALKVADNEKAKLNALRNSK